MRIGETNKLLSMMETYLVHCGGSVMHFRINLVRGQRIGQAFFNALSDKDQKKLRGTFHDPFYEIHPERLWVTLEWLIDHT